MRGRSGSRKAGMNKDQRELLAISVVAAVIAIAAFAVDWISTSIGAAIGACVLVVYALRTGKK
jgi:Flp pilus assembly protein TadB